MADISEILKVEIFHTKFLNEKQGQAGNTAVYFSEVILLYISSHVNNGAPRLLKSWTALL